MQLAQLVEYVSQQLADQEGGFGYTSWPINQLINTYNDAVSAIQAHRPELLATTSPFVLAAGSIQTLPLSFGDFITIANNGNGLVPRQTDATLAGAFNKPGCCPPPLDLACSGGPAAYAPTSVSHDPRDGRSFRVYPPVPPGTAVTVQVRHIPRAVVFNFSNWNDLIPVDPAYLSVLVEWMLKRAYEVDDESVASTEKAGYHARNFFTLLGVKYRQDSLHNSRWYEGAKGNPDVRMG